MNIVTNAQVTTYLDGVAIVAGSFLEKLIAIVSARIAQHCGRTAWDSQERTEYKDGGCRMVLLDVWPVTEVSEVNDDPLHDWPDDNALDASSYYVDALGSLYNENGSFLCGDSSVKVTYTGGYSSQSEIPEMIQNAALIQIKSEYLQQQPGRIPAPFEQADSDGLLPEVRSLLVPYRRRKL